MPEAVLTEEQLQAEIKRRFDAMLSEAGISGGLEGLKRSQASIEAKVKAFDDRVAADAAARASTVVTSELDTVLKRAVDSDPNARAFVGADDVAHSRFEKFGTAALFSVARWRLQSIAKERGFGPSNEGACKIAAEMARNAATKHDREYFEVLGRSLSAGNFADGGALIPEDLRSEILPLYTANTVIRKYAMNVPMPSGSITWPRQTSGVAPGYVPESGIAAVSTPALDQLKLSAKKLRVLTPITNDLMRYAGSQTDVWLRNRLATDFAVAEDAAFIRGTGSSATVKGIRYQALGTHVTAETKAGAAVTLQELVTDLFDMLDDLKSSNVPFGPAWRWLSSPTAFSGIAQRLNSNGFFVFQNELIAGRLIGLGFDETTGVPSNLGGSSNQSEMYLIDYANVIVGDARGLELDFVPNATWDSGSGLVSGVSTDQSVFVGTLASDVGLAHDSAASVRTGVDWQIV